MDSKTRLVSTFDKTLLAGLGCGVFILCGIIEQAQARRAELVALGLERAREFTWERAADSALALWGGLG